MAELIYYTNGWFLEKQDILTQEGDLVKNRTKYIVAAGIVLIAAIILGTAFIYYENSRWKDSKLENAEYEGVYCAMDSTPFFSEEEFLDYRGLNIVISEKHLESFKHIGEMLDIVYTNNPGVNTVYMEVNPVTLWKDASALGDKWAEYMEKYLLETIRQQSGTTFEFLLANPQISYWTEADEKQVEEFLQAYQTFVNTVDAFDNVLVFYVGAEQWLNDNEDNYADIFQLNSRVEKNIFLSAFCDRRFLVDSSVMADKLSGLKEQIERSRNSEKEYPDYGEYSFVFLGDSIIGNDMSTCSIPGVVGALTDASVYNCGKSGAAATSDAEAELSMLDLVNALTEGNTDKILEEDLLENIERFLQDDHAEDRLCFFINFGLNDYYIGYPLDNPEEPYDEYTYAGALRSGIKQLKEAYPGAEVVVMVPTYIIFYNEGMDVMSARGGQLARYREIAEAVAEEMQVHCKNNYVDMQMDSSNQEEYLADGCHLNEWGRYYLGEQIVRFLEEILAE